MKITFVFSRSCILRILLSTFGPARSRAPPGSALRAGGRCFSILFLSGSGGAFRRILAQINSDNRLRRAEFGSAFLFRSAIPRNDNDVPAADPQPLFLSRI